MLKEFGFNYQRRTALSDTIVIEKARKLASELEIRRNALQFSGWLQKFKDHNGIRLRIFEKVMSAKTPKARESEVIVFHRFIEASPS